MNSASALLGCFLAAGAGALVYADYSGLPPEHPRSLQLARYYLTDDAADVANLQSRPQKLRPPAIQPFARATLDRDPASPYRWCDLGESLAGIQEREHAAYCYREASRLAPHDPQTLLNLGDYYASISNTPAAVDTFRLLLVETGAPVDSSLPPLVFDYYERLKVRHLGLLARALPDAVTSRAYLRYLMRTSDPAAVAEAWALIREREADDDQLTVEYANYLAGRNLGEAAAEVWARHFSGRNDGYPRANAVFNASFEFELLRGPFDWQFSERPGVAAVRDPAAAIDGRFAMRLEFSANDNAEFHYFGQTVFVHPGRYRFAGMMKTKDITSDEGIRFSVGAGSTPPVYTQALKGTTGWTSLEAELEVPQSASLIRINVARQRSIRIDNQLTGSVWIDAVKLTRIP